MCLPQSSREFFRLEVDGNVRNQFACMEVQVHLPKGLLTRFRLVLN